ncbi:hypothetical protein H0H81_009452, partial [Sphagnurus paluster]
MANTQVTLVSPWAHDGDLSSFLEANTEASRSLLCLNVTQGLEFLHKKRVVHGDLKGVNVLVDSSHRAYLADFGLSGFDDLEIVQWTTQSAEASKGGTVRYQAPELFPTEQSLVFGMRYIRIPNSFLVGLDSYAKGKIFTDKVPFYATPDHFVAFQVIKGKRPTKPASPMPNGLLETLWTFM